MADPTGHYLFVDVNEHEVGWWFDMMMIRMVLVKKNDDVMTTMNEDKG